MRLLVLLRRLMRVKKMYRFIFIFLVLVLVNAVIIVGAIFSAWDLKYINLGEWHPMFRILLFGVNFCIALLANHYYEKL